MKWSGCWWECFIWKVIRKGRQSVSGQSLACIQLEVMLHLTTLLLSLTAGGLLLLVSADTEERPELEVTGLGRLRGVYQKTLGGREIAAFLGVPYAKTPARFQMAEAPVPWDGVLDASKIKDYCTQYSQITLRSDGSEDCLYADIFTPKNFNTSEKLLDVVIYIYGGAFSFKVSDFGPKYLLDHDVVYVTFNYRVGPLGFLSTGDSVLPGNLGLKDQNRLLRWVSKYIRYFGGNPERVLLTGTSAGSASVHYQLLSPLSKGLFHGAFSMSGTALDCWTQSEGAAEKAKQLGQNLGCPTGSSRELLACLEGKDPHSITQQMANFQKWRYYPFTPFGPVVEPDSPTAFISKYPSEIIRDGEVMDVPWLVTFNSEEGLYPVAEFLSNETILDYLDKHWNEVLPSVLDFEYTTTLFEKSAVSQKIRQHYIGNSSLKSNVRSLINMCSDRLFLDGIVRAAQLQAGHIRSPVYSYQFSYRGAHSGTEFLAKKKENLGVCHGDDTGYMFNNVVINAEDTENDREMVKILTQMVAHFAATGRPFLEGLDDWPEVCAEKDFTFVNIEGPKNYEVISDPQIGQTKFWTTLKLAED